MPTRAHRRSRALPREVTRPQQARSAATRRKLLDATVACLVERGYAGTSTTEVCRRAGVSQGALFKHYPSKLQLLAAAVHHLFARLIRQYRRSFDAVGKVGTSGHDRLGQALRLLRRTFAKPELQVAFELYLAARTDSALRAVIEPALEQHRANLRREARRVLPEIALLHPDFDALVDTVMDALQGAAIGTLSLPDPMSEERELGLLERMIRREFAHPGEV